MSSRNEGVSVIADFNDKAVPLVSAPVNGAAFTYRHLEPRLKKLGVDHVKTVTIAPPVHLWYSPRTMKALTVQDRGDAALDASTLDKICTEFGISRTELDNAA